MSEICNVECRKNSEGNQFVSEGWSRPSEILQTFLLARDYEKVAYPWSTNLS